MRGNSNLALVLSCLLLYFSEAISQVTINWNGPGVNLPTRENFLRRCFHRCALHSFSRSVLFTDASVPAIVVGNYLYIDGGELSQISQPSGEVVVNTGILAPPTPTATHADLQQKISRSQST
jgi:hypothetical protein